MVMMRVSSPRMVRYADRRAGNSMLKREPKSPEVLLCLSKDFQDKPSVSSVICQ